MLLVFVPLAVAPLDLDQFLADLRSQHSPIVLFVRHLETYTSPPFGADNDGGSYTSQIWRTMAGKAIAQAVAAPSRWLAMLIAAVLVAVFLIACVLLYIHADDTPEPVWNHWIKIFEALGPMVGLALGWVFGKEVHRKAAESAMRKADYGSELAGVVRQWVPNVRSSA